MRKKLDTRFPAARIKKIMQADEEVGKIALATPVLISKALEIFLQDLCDRTYDITCKRGAKTLAASHLKQCVASFSEYDFLKDVVSKLPDVDAPDSPDDAPSGRLKRKLSDDDQEDPISPRSKESKATRAKSNGCNDVVKLKSVGSLTAEGAECSIAHGLKKRGDTDDVKPAAGHVPKKRDIVTVKPAKRTKSSVDQLKPVFKVTKVKIPKRIGIDDVLDTPATTSRLKVEVSGAAPSIQAPLKVEIPEGSMKEEARPLQAEVQSSPRGFDLNFDLNAVPPEDAACHREECQAGQPELGSHELMPRQVQCHAQDTVMACTSKQIGAVVTPPLRNCVTYDSEDDYDCDDGA